MTGLSAGSGKSAVEIIDLHKRFGTVEVIKGVSLSASYGNVISLIGASGSGKSTLLRCINFLEVPSSGRVLVDGEEIALRVDRHGGAAPADQKQIARIRSQLGMVFQNFNLWPHMTVLENVIEAPMQVLGLPKAACVERAEELLRKVGLAEQERQLSGVPFRRTAAACGHRPRAGHGAESDAVRRAHVGP